MTSGDALAEAERDVRESSEYVLKQAALVTALEKADLLELTEQAREVLEFLRASLDLSPARLRV
jgi:hypothetical protein